MPGPQDFAEAYVTAERLDAELAVWMKELEPYRWREVEPLQPARVALLVVDMTRPFVEEGEPLSSPNARAILPRVTELVAAFRSAKRPVLWIVQGHHSVEHDRGARLSAWWPKPLLEGTADVEMAAGLAPLKSEKVVLKRRYSGFYATDLELTLRNLGVGQLVICGVLTNVCPFATAMDAFSRDFCVYYPPDATAAPNRDMHLAALRTISGWCGHLVPAREIAGGLG
ncbi:MAG: isochorismatase family protein [Planctomycetota bacterium]|jgi:nicotinamidase-related amidase